MLVYYIEIVWTTGDEYWLHLYVYTIHPFVFIKNRTIKNDFEVHVTKVLQSVHTNKTEIQPIDFNVTFPCQI
jgi:hypothetical protein